jgi:antitoxin HigA-1
MPRPAIHPGEILAEELAELGVTPTELSRQINVPPNRVTQIIHGRRGITGDTALRLGHWFGTSAQFWLNLQSAYDIRVAKEKAWQEIAQLPTRPAGPIAAEGADDALINLQAGHIGQRFYQGRMAQHRNREEAVNTSSGACEAPSSSEGSLLAIFRLSVNKFRQNATRIGSGLRLQASVAQQP